MSSEFYIVTGFILIGLAGCKLFELIRYFFDMRFAADSVEDLKFSIMRLFLEQQNILAELGIKINLRLYNDKFFDRIDELYKKMYESYKYISYDTNSRLKRDYVDKLKNNYGDNINAINTTITLLNSYACMCNYARDMLPTIVCGKEAKFVDNINPMQDHGIEGTGCGLI